MQDMTKLYAGIIDRKIDSINNYKDIISNMQIEIDTLSQVLHRNNSDVVTLKTNITRLEEEKADYEKDREGYELELQDLRDKLEVRDGTIESQDIEIENLKIKLKQKL